MPPKNIIDTATLLKLKGKYMVSLNGPHGTFNNVIFHPSKATIEVIQAAAADEQAYKIEIVDDSGEYVMNIPRYISGVRYQYDTLLFVTNG